MKQKVKVGAKILLVLASIVVMCYNFTAEREIAYVASIAAVCGTSAILAQEVYRVKTRTEEKDSTDKEEKHP